MSFDRPSLSIRWAGQRHLRLAFHGTAAAALAAVQRSYRQLKTTPIPGLVDITPAAQTLLLEFELLGLPDSALEQQVLAALATDPTTSADQVDRLVEIPVCYGGEFGPDAEAVAGLQSLSTGELFALHAAADYRVQFIGFVPGFAYLGPVPAQIATPRHDRPRPVVPAGSVGLAGDRTGVYPRATPGGWQLIGRTPLVLFDAHLDPPNLLAPGDRVRFRAIDRDEFRHIQRPRRR